MVNITFTSPGNPPNNIAQFRIERSERASDGTIALIGDIDNVLKVITVTFTTAPADGTLAGDSMHIGGLLYRIVTNTATTITFTSETDLSTIVSFPATFEIMNDLAEFGTFETVGTITPSVPFTANTMHQFTDSTGTIFDFYRIRSIDTGGNVSDPLSSPFRPGQIVTLSIDDRRKDPKDSLKGTIGGAIEFEVEVIMGGRKQDPKDNLVYADLFMPSYLSPTGTFQIMETVQLARVGKARYKGTWNIPTYIASKNITIRPSDEYFVSYKANFMGLLDSLPDSFLEFDSELFTLEFIDGPIMGRFPAYATVEDVRMTLFEVDAYLPESIDKSDLDSRNKVLQYHIETASDKLREELNIHQVRSNSSDRKEYVAVRAVYSLLMAARGQNSSAVSDSFVTMWKERAEYILEQLKREGIAQGLPLGRG